MSYGCQVRRAVWSLTALGCDTTAVTTADDATCGSGQSSTAAAFIYAAMNDLTLILSILDSMELVGCAANTY